MSSLVQSHGSFCYTLPIVLLVCSLSQALQAESLGDDQRMGIPPGDYVLVAKKETSLPANCMDQNRSTPGADTVFVSANAEMTLRYRDHKGMKKVPLQQAIEERLVRLTGKGSTRAVGVELCNASITQASIKVSRLGFLGETKADVPALIKEVQGETLLELRRMAAAERIVMNHMVAIGKKAERAAGMLQDRYWAVRSGKKQEEMQDIASIYEGKLQGQVDTKVLAGKLKRGLTLFDGNDFFPPACLADGAFQPWARDLIELARGEPIDQKFERQIKEVLGLSLPGRSDYFTKHAILQPAANGSGVDCLLRGQQWAGIDLGSTLPFDAKRLQPLRYLKVLGGFDAHLQQNLQDWRQYGSFVANRGETFLQKSPEGVKRIRVALCVERSETSSNSRSESRSKDADINLARQLVKQQAAADWRIITSRREAEDMAQSAIEGDVIIWVGHDYRDRGGYHVGSSTRLLSLDAFAELPGRHVVIPCNNRTRHSKGIFNRKKDVITAHAALKMGRLLQALAGQVSDASEVDSSPTIDVMLWQTFSTYLEGHAKRFIAIETMPRVYRLYTDH